MSEKVNNLMKDIINIFKEYNMIQDLMSNFEKQFKNHFMADNINLWYIDEMSGILYTINSQNKELRAVSGVGLFGELL